MQPSLSTRLSLLTPSPSFWLLCFLDFSFPDFVFIRPPPPTLAENGSDFYMSPKWTDTQLHHHADMLQPLHKHQLMKAVVRVQQKKMHFKAVTLAFSYNEAHALIPWKGKRTFNPLVKMDLLRSAGKISVKLTDFFSYFSLIFLNTRWLFLFLETWPYIKKKQLLLVFMFFAYSSLYC